MKRTANTADRSQITPGEASRLVYDTGAHEPAETPQDGREVMDVADVQAELFPPPALQQARERPPKRPQRTAGGFRVVRVESCKIGSGPTACRYARLTVASGPLVIESTLLATTDTVIWPWNWSVDDTAREQAEADVLDAAREALRESGRFG